MMNVTQGNTIFGMRSSKYPGVLTYGIIISASCDLAHDKVDKIYYLVAVPIEDWIFSNSGLEKMLSSSITNCVNELEIKCANYELDFESLRSFSERERSIILEENCKDSKDKKKISELFTKYEKYASVTLSKQERKEILGIEKNQVHKYLTDIINGQNTHYIFLPQEAFGENGEINNGLIIDLQELNYVNRDELLKLTKYEIDEKVLSDEEKYLYDKKFFIFENPGFAVLQNGIKSPWREYMMQHFSNSFIRIGINTLNKKEISSIIENILEDKQ